MSLKPIRDQSAHRERLASRRNVVRGAAWTTAAVTVVVATPNIAAATPGSKRISGSYANVSIVKAVDKSVQTLTWTFDLKITPTQDIPAGGLSVTFTGVSNVTALQVKTGSTTWTGSGTSTRSYPVAVLAGAERTIRIVATFTRSTNSGSGTASGTFSASGFTGSIIATSAY